LYYIEDKKGKGAKAAPGKTVRVHFTGKFLDGRIFDSSHKYDAPVEFKLGAGEAIEGWDAGISYMAEGGQARLLLPSRLAFGDSYNGSIPPFSPVLYEIELLSVR
jgi:FKBP-type peptidyl-prolyl cis-trans isomerase